MTASPHPIPHLVLIDGHALCYQAFYALPPMSAPDGRGTQVPYGVLSTLFKLVRQLKPSFLVVTFDAPGPTFRHEAFQSYKIHRPPTPEGLHTQIELLKTVLKDLGIVQTELKGYEADDLLGTLSARAEARGWRTTLVTSDKDAGQLLSDKVSVFDPRRNAGMGPAELLVQKGMTPGQVPDYLALTGDSSDNVPGVEGIGPKTAVKLLASAGSLEALLKDPAAHATSRIAEALTAGTAQARASLSLATIDRKVPLDLDLDAAVLPSGIPPEAAESMKSLGFHRFLAEFPASGAEAPQPPAPAAATPSVRRVDALPPLAGTWALERGESGIVLAAAQGEPLLCAPELLVKAPSWEGASLIGHDLKPALVSLRQAGLKDTPRIVFDTLLAAYLLNPESGNRLEDLAREHLGRELPRPPAAARGKKAEPEAPEAMEGRAAARATASRDLVAPLRAALQAQGLERLMEDIELPLLPILVGMELEGIALDKGVLGEISAEIGKRLAGLETRIHAEAGHPFTIGSPKQLAQVLFEELKLPHGRKGKTGYSTDAEVLEDLASVHTLPALVLEYRQLDKLKNTYVDALPSLTGADGRLHTTFNQAVAATGRLSSTRPNLQNIPIRTEIGQRIRGAFRPHAKGDVLLTADYSQIELRVLAHVSADRAMTSAFSKGEDIHAAVAARIHGVDLSGVTDAMRDFAKTVNFSVIYGKTAFTLARDLKKTVKEAQAFIDAYFREFSGVKSFIDRTIADARARGFVCTLSGRRRPVPFLASPNPAQRMAAERVAVNTVIQGTAADLMKMAMIRVDAALQAARSPARILLQIHDELVLNVPRNREEEARRLVVEAMTSAMVLDVPLAVNTASGDTWRAAA